MWPVDTDGLAWSVCLSTIMSPAKTAGLKHRNTLPWGVQKWLNRSRCHLGCEVWARVVTRKRVIDGGPDPCMWGGYFEGKKGSAREKCPLLIILKATQQGIERVCCGCWLGRTLAPAGKYDWTVCARRRCGIALTTCLVLVQIGLSSTKDSLWKQQEQIITHWMMFILPNCNSVRRHWRIQGNDTNQMKSFTGEDCIKTAYEIQ